MIQFTAQEREELQRKAATRTEMLAKIKKQVEPVYREPCLIPETGIGNWTLYYYCPECSVELTVDRHSPDRHGCPVCGCVYEGEPYDSAWWGFMHMENYRASYLMGLYYLLTGDRSYGEKAVEMMCGYGKCYGNYQVHGDIPYNGPGKACAQTLDEAILLRTFAMTYDLTEELMTMEEKRLVKEELLIPGAEFLMAHRSRQIHNHEVIIDSAIGVIGLLFDRRDLIEAGVYEEYGLLYQLEHGMLPYGIWFEGSFGYHFFALESFFAYEKFAVHTKHGHMDHPNYQKMLEVPVFYVLPDGGLPMMNDTTYGHGLTGAGLYEFACSRIKSPVMPDYLQMLYRQQDRDSLESLLYGRQDRDSLESLVYERQDRDSPGVLKAYHTPVGGPGHTILKGDGGRTLLFKHDPYGGEHDHYDRLSISFQAFGKKIARDLGTTGYGAKLHYDYYKNTGTHNTVVIGEENQSPAACKLTRYEEKDGITYVEAVCCWRDDYQKPDTFTIVQWSEEAYKNVRMTRKIAWAGKWFAELFLVEGVGEGLTADWVMHVAGSRKEETARSRAENGQIWSKKPFCHLRNVKKQPCVGQMVNSYVEEGISTDVYSYVPEGELYTALGPDNPSYHDLNYIIERRISSQSLFLHVVEAYEKEKAVEWVEFVIPAGGDGPDTDREAGSVIIRVADADGIHEIEF